MVCAATSEYSDCVEDVKTWLAGLDTEWPAEYGFGMGSGVHGLMGCEANSKFRKRLRRINSYITASFTIPLWMEGVGPTTDAFFYSFPALKS